MKITPEQVRYVANLGNLRLNDDEIAALAKDMDELLVYMEKLNEIDTTGVEPMAQVLYEAEETATLREDVERPERKFDSATATANSALAAQGYFKVPKVIDRQ